MPNTIRPTQHSLIRRLKNLDDQDAWHQFYQHYWDLIFSWAKRYGCNNDLAQDICQETIVCLLKNISDFDYQPEKGLFRSYLKTIVFRRTTDLYRKNRKYLAEADLKQNTEEPEQNSFFDINLTKEESEQQIDLTWLKTNLLKALKKAYKKVDQVTYKSFCLYVLDGVPVKQVCQQLKIEREGTVYQQKSRFLSILKKEFESILLDVDNSFCVNNRNFDKLFMETFNEFIKDKPEMRQTLINNSIPQALKNRLDIIQAVLKDLRKDCIGSSLIQFSVENYSVHTKHIIKLPEEKILIGSREDCLIQLTNEDVSGYHASIDLSRSLLLNDENSTNGTYVNGRKTACKELVDGDIIQIADYNFLFSMKQQQDMVK